MKTKVYIAGPYTNGDVAENVGNAMSTYFELANMGYYPYCPHLTHFLHLYHPHPKEFWMKQDRIWLLSCQAILVLPGGSSQAVHEAIIYSIPVFFTVEEIKERFPQHEHDD